MANPWDEFEDAPKQNAWDNLQDAKPAGNPWDQFDDAPKETGLLSKINKP